MLLPIGHLLFDQLRQAHHVLCPGSLVGLRLLFEFRVLSSPLSLPGGLVRQLMMLRLLWVSACDIVLCLYGILQPTIMHHIAL